VKEHLLESLILGVNRRNYEPSIQKEQEIFEKKSITSNALEERKLVRPSLVKSDVAAVERSVEHFLRGGLWAACGPISSDFQCVNDCVIKESTVQIVRQMIRKFSRSSEKSTALANDLTNSRSQAMPAKP
jgi:hypothetical protein